MNVLIVNAFGDNPNGKKKFDEFVQIIKKTFKTCTEKSGMENIQFLIRDYNDIDEFIYYNENYPNSNMNPANKKNFEKLDFIFIDGIEKYLPWNNRGSKFQNILKMCKITNKPLFAAGVGMQILIYFLATNFHTDVNMINSNGEIESIEEINNIPKNFLSNLKKYDYFLDYVTGDVYEYRSNSKDWSPVMNVGLHKVKIAEKFMHRGKYVLNMHNYRPKSVNSKNVLTTVNTELRAHTQKQFLSHWIMKNLPLEFVVFSTSSWFSHNFNLKQKELQYKICSSCEKGPIIIEHDNSVGVAFHILRKYPDSVKILENFIFHKYNEVQEKTYLNGYNNLNNKASNNTNFENIHVERFLKKTKMEITLKNNELIEYNTSKRKIISSPTSSIQSSPNGSFYKDKAHRSTSSYLVNSSRPFSQIKHVKHLGSHVGFGFNKRDMIFVENNAVNTRPISSLKGSNNLPINRPASPYTTTNSFAFYLQNMNFTNNIDKESINDSQNLFGNKLNIFYNGDVNSLKVIGTPSKNNRIAKLLEAPINDHKKKKTFTTIDELKKYVDETDVGNENYLNFVDKDSIDENKIIDFYKKKRREITNHLVELTKKKDNSVNRLSDLKIFNKKTINNYDSSRSNSRILSSDNNQLKNSNNKQPTQDSQNNNLNTDEFVPAQRRSQKNENVNFFSMMFPYVRREEFPNSVERHIIGTGIEKETDGKDIVKVDNMRKSTNNFNRLFKKYEKDLNNFASKPSVRCSSPYLSEDHNKRKEILETKSKWVSNKDFRRVFGKHTTQMKIVSSVIATGSPPRSTQHQYRETDRNKWISNKNFIV